MQIHIRNSRSLFINEYGCLSSRCITALRGYTTFGLATTGNWQPFVYRLGTRKLANNSQTKCSI
uniref:Uncharacterized protein n=1 Tax=Siphoviridae sp. ctTXt1 TaxID=2825520 RepID=A0A8S5PB42_9CAUD|nr:MAG TPA: hypothetical protein [Siphoviridae sp. ctTXt1]DAZ37806.1 MAG TPA: hypothetical protein [Caudoviricetes sp.]